jgi:hypothetical protein
MFEHTPRIHTRFVSYYDQNILNRKDDLFCEVGLLTWILECPDEKALVEIIFRVFPK